MFNKISALIVLSTLSYSAGVSAQDYTYDPQRTAILLVDPYNEFLSEGGLLYPLSKETLEANNAIENVKELVSSARESGVKVIYVPHHHYREGDYRGW